MPFQTIAILSGDRQKTIPNRTEAEVLSEIVIPFIANGVITAKWGAKVQSYQVLELRIFDTKEPWSKVKGPIAMVLKGKKNVYKRFSDKAESLLSAHFSDRGHLFQADRGRRFRAIVDAQGMRASEGLNVSQSSKRSEATHREAACWIATSQTYPRRRAALATYRPTRWVSRLGH